MPPDGASGHRRCRDRDLRRLYRIRALRGLGLSLEEVTGVLAGSTDDIAAIRDLLLAQLAGLTARASRIEQLASQLRGVLALIDGGGTPSAEDLMVTLEMMSVFESYFTHEQRDRLAGRRADLGQEIKRAARAMWDDNQAELGRRLPWPPEQVSAVVAYLDRARMANRPGG